MFRKTNPLVIFHHPLSVFLTTLAISFICNTTYGQSGKTISGMVTDSLHKPLVYATVRILKNNKQPLKSTYTNERGLFQLQVDSGRYELVVSHTGFASVSRQVVVGKGGLQIETIYLRTDKQLLQDVTVAARKPLIEQAADKIIYNVDSDPAAKAEMATDILRKTPLVTVDGEGNVQLNGQSNFKILLNGRETSMFAQNVKDALKNFPGAVISRIEIITAPSAKYDAEGVGGIINIVTKKRVVGYNGYVSSYLSTMGNISESATLSVKAGKLGISSYIGVNGVAGRISNRSTSETTPYVPTLFSKRTLEGERLNSNRGGYANLEISYDLDSLNTLTAYGNLGVNRSQSELEQSIITAHTTRPAERGLFQQDNVSRSPSSGMGADFIRKYRNQPEKELSFRFNGQFSRSDALTNSLQGGALLERYVSNTNEARNHEYTLQGDLVQPLSKTSRLETGAKAIFRAASAEFLSLAKYSATDSYKPAPSNSDQFDYHQEVYSVYTSYNLNIKTYSMRLGARAEHTDIKGEFVSSKSTVEQHYTNLIPNLLVTKKFSPLYTVSFSYNMRLQRPYITNLNPFVNNNDSLSVSYGNPQLGPQVLHAVSLQNRLTKGKLFAVLTANASYTRNMIVQFSLFNPANAVTSTTSANAGREWQANVGFSLNTPVGKKLRIGFFPSVRYNNIENRLNLLQHRKGFSGSVSANFNYNVIGKFTLSGSGVILRTPYALVGTLSNTLYFYQINFGYKFFNDKLSATMNVNNFHGRYFTFRSVTENPDFRVVNTTVSPYLVIYWGLTYNFGKLKESVSKKKGVTNDDLVQ